MPTDTMLVLQERPLGDDVLLGVATGLATGVVLFLLTVIWRSYLRPQIESFFYNGHNVSGEWHLCTPIAETEGALDWRQTESFTVVQSAYRISGILTLTPKTEKDGATAIHDLRGEIRDGFFSASTCSRDSRRLGRTHILARISGDGNQLVGESVYYDVINDCITSAAVVYKRRGPGIGPSGAPSSGTTEQPSSGSGDGNQQGPSDSPG